MLPNLETPDHLLEDDEIDRADVEDEWDDFADLPDDEDDGESEVDLARFEFDDFYDEVFRALGHDITPGHDELHHYWVAGPGLAKWAFSPKPWTTLVALLTRHVGLHRAKIYASRWFIEHFGFAAGSDKNRVMHGQPPRGHRIGPG